MINWEVPRMPKATELKQFINVFSPFPLNDNNFDDFYVDTTKVRGNEMKKLEYTCLYGEHPYAKILFSGQMGSGKTTELYKLSKNIESRYEIVHVSVLKDLDIYNVSYVDFIFEIMSAILLHFDIEELQKLKDDSFAQLYNYWHSEHFKEIIYTDDSEAEMMSTIKASGSVGASVNLVARIKFLLNVAIKGQGIIKTSTSTKDELKTKLALRISDLIAAINSMLIEIDNIFEDKELLVIVEDLDKADESSIKEIFTKYFAQLSSINVKMIFNIPISLEYSLDFKKIKDSANANFMLNTINVFDDYDCPNDSNVQFFKKFVYKRAEEHFFDNEALEYMICKSGGILRDLFAILVDASLNAMIEHPEVEQILHEDAKNACIKLRNEYVKSIETKIQYDRLLDIYHKNNSFEDGILLRLLQANLVIEYGESKEYLVHPLVVDYMKYKGDIHD